MEERIVYEIFPIPGVILQCRNCKFRWIAGYAEEAPILLKKLYETNKECLKCNHDEVEVIHLRA